jgi:rare lipoprotein A (peptidoglycan hydrolase)
MPSIFKYPFLLLLTTAIWVVQASAQQNDDTAANVYFQEVEYKPVGPIKKGTASYYSLKFEGRKTATGAKFSHVKYTAASNHYPLGIYVKVVNPKNKLFVIVKINDRMAKSMSKKGRIVDLTRVAAKEIGIFNQGIGKVLVQKVEKLPNK